jgi:ribonuclease BN (tRNA processing enzyme)
MYYQHMNIEEFFRAADELNAKTVIPMHFGTISLSDEPLVYPLYAIRIYIEENPRFASRIKALRVGEYFDI